MYMIWISFQTAKYAKNCIQIHLLNLRDKVLWFYAFIFAVPDFANHQNYLSYWQSEDEEQPAEIKIDLDVCTIPVSYNLTRKTIIGAAGKWYYCIMEKRPRDKKDDYCRWNDDQNESRDHMQSIQTCT